MAVFVTQKPVVTQGPVVTVGGPPARDAAAPTLAPALATETAAAADDKTTAGKAVAPGVGYMAVAAIAIVVGGWAGTWVYDNLAKAVSFTPPEGVGIFALFYVMAQVIERVQEPLAPYLGRAKEDSNSGQNQLQAKAALERAVVDALTDPSLDNAKAVANKTRTTDQIRANLTVLLFGTSALLAMLMSGFLKARLLQTVGVKGSVTWLDVVVTGLVVGAGTKPLHDLISNLSASKESKQKPPGTA